MQNKDMEIYVRLVVHWSSAVMTHQCWTAESEKGYKREGDEGAVDGEGGSAGEEGTEKRIDSSRNCSEPPP